MLAYLVIREGTKWTDVFRLVPGQTVTIGRAPSNQIVVKDDRCSRQHAEIVPRDGGWVLRDLQSRNGTVVGEQLVAGEVPLAPGDVIRIGASQLAFVNDLSKAFPDPGGLLRPAARADDRAVDRTVADASALVEELREPTMITHRRVQTRFFDAPDDDDESIPRVGRAATKLCRLAFELAQAPDAVTVANLALAGLFEETGVDAGAVWMLARDPLDGPPEAALEMVASRTETSLSYHRISSFLASNVLRDGEAVLARNILGDSSISTRDSQGEIHATSVLCAPIRRESRPVGLVHLYSTRHDRALDADDLEFTLAVADTIGVALANLKRRQELAENLNVVQDENQQLRERLGAESELVGRSKALERIAEQIRRAAPSGATVLIRGESGVGKELVARAVHYSSPRRKGPFVCVNCAALSETLLESELFGHERGAFTGAVTRKIGKFEASHQGTLFLDEIGEMSPAVQAKFLRVLEGHPFERVGGSEPVRVDVRVLAATNRELERDVEQGRFRRDLYFRLRVVDIVIPPLRKRPDDIADLAYHFFHRYTAQTGRRLRGITPRAMEQLLRYRWPGNVRELKNVIERAVVLAQGEVIDESDLILSTIPTSGDTGEVLPAPLSAITVAAGAAARPQSLDEVERQHILSTLRATNWNKSQAAHLLGIERSTLDRKIRRYELSELAPRRVVEPGPS